MTGAAGPTAVVRVPARGVRQTPHLSVRSHGWTWGGIWGGFGGDLSPRTRPPAWNAGAWLHIPHAGSTWEHSVPSVRTQTVRNANCAPRRKVWTFGGPGYEDTTTLSWTLIWLNPPRCAEHLLKMERVVKLTT